MLLLLLFICNVLAGVYVCGIGTSAEQSWQWWKCCWRCRDDGACWQWLLHRETTSWQVVWLPDWRHSVPLETLSQEEGWHTRRWHGVRLIGLRLILSLILASILCTLVALGSKKSKCLSFFPTILWCLVVSLGLSYLGHQSLSMPWLIAPDCRCSHSLS